MCNWPILFWNIIDSGFFPVQVTDILQYFQIWYTDYQIQIPYGKWVLADLHGPTETMKPHILKTSLQDNHICATRQESPV